MIVSVSLASIGASGSVYGLMLFFIMDRLIAMQTNTGRRLFILMQLCYTGVTPFQPSAICSMIIHRLNVAHSAHFGGGLTGFLFGIGMRGCPLPCNTEHGIFRTTCRCIAFVLLFLYYVITLTIFFLKDAPIIYWILYRH